MKKVLPHLSLCLLALISGCMGETSKIGVREAGVAPPLASLAEAQMLSARGEYALAIEAYRKVIRFEPDNAAAYAGLGASYARMGRGDLADRYFQLALARAPHDPALLAAHTALSRDEAASPAPATFHPIAASSLRIVPDPPGAPTDTRLPALRLVRLDRQSLAEVRLVTRPMLGARIAPEASRRENIAVTVRNGVGRKGIAGRMRRYLVQEGWQVAAVGDAQPRYRQSRLIVAENNIAAADAMRRRLPFDAMLIPQHGHRGVTLILGANARDFDNDLKERRL